jgi:AAA+ superfamily predicted ATPase
MEIITIKVKNSSDALKIMELLKKQPIQMEVTKKNKVAKKGKELSNEEILDKGLLNAMEQGKKTKFVPKSSIMKKLKKNEGKVSSKV